MPDTIANVLAAARKALIAADIDGSALDARVLLQTASGLLHEDIIAAPEMVLDAATLEKFSNFIKRRLAHEPVSRILGSREFFGREFMVTPAVLDPRADTESLIELILERFPYTVIPAKAGTQLSSDVNLAQRDSRFRGKDGLGGGRILDIGTGSGAILITLLAERPAFDGVAVDISPEALHVAKVNGLANGVSGRLHLHQGSWFNGLDGTFDLIVSNPPYIPHGDIAGLEVDVKDYDPHLALDGGADGLFAYRAIAADAGLFLAVNGEIAVEIGAGQQTEVTSIFAAKGFSLLATRKDLGGHVRALIFG